jgi:hypothetical protein
MKSHSEIIKGLFHLLEIVCFYFFQLLGSIKVTSEKNIEADLNNNCIVELRQNQNGSNTTNNQQHIKTSFITKVDSSKMFDFKMCLLDLLRLQMQPKRKSLKELSCRYNEDYLKKYNDVSVIHFNENMSMVNKLNNIRFAPCPRNLTSTLSKQRGLHTTNNNSAMMSARPLGFGGTRSLREWGVETVSFDFSSETSETSYAIRSSYESQTPSITAATTPSSSDEGNVELNDVVGFDSFCTLCTSSFSFNNCKCDKSVCGSKCSSIITDGAMVSVEKVKTCQCSAADLLRDQLLTRMHNATM